MRAFHCPILDRKRYWKHSKQPDLNNNSEEYYTISFFTNGQLQRLSPVPSRTRIARFLLYAASTCADFGISYDSRYCQLILMSRNGVRFKKEHYFHFMHCLLSTDSFTLGWFHKRKKRIYYQIFVLENYGAGVKQQRLAERLRG